MDMTTKATKAKKTKGPEEAKTARAELELVREYGPFGRGNVHGVTWDGERVWFATDDHLVAFDPENGEEVSRLDVPAKAGTAFDGESLYQLADGEILVVRPKDGEVLRRMPAPGKGMDSGMAYADGYLWIGEYKESRIHQVDAKTGEVVKTLRSDRWVTGVSCVDGALWHATTADDGKAAEVRRLAPDGTVEESLAVPEGLFVSGLERTSDGRFWCGGASSGKVRLLRARVRS